MNNIIVGYARAIIRYLRTEKGRHDAKDYGRALLIMVLIMILVRIAAALIF